LEAAEPKRRNVSLQSPITVINERPRFGTRAAYEGDSPFAMSQTPQLSVLELLKCWLETGPIWTPLILSTMPPEKVKNFGKHVPVQPPGQPKELAPAYVMLASEEASYISGATGSECGSATTYENLISSSRQLT